ncbi:hypothetical protein C8J56DRAFT_152488 [Mycena floridula]|nr:hypothetical protein C8J56DRAFT_152488 [Mycena floridula]
MEGSSSLCSNLFLHYARHVALLLLNDIVQQNRDGGKRAKQGNRLVGPSLAFNHVASGYLRKMVGFLCWQSFILHWLISLPFYDDLMLNQSRPQHEVDSSFVLSFCFGSVPLFVLYMHLSIISILISCLFFISASFVCLTGTTMFRSSFSADIIFLANRSIPYVSRFCILGLSLAFLSIIATMK